MEHSIGVSPNSSLLIRKSDQPVPLELSSVEVVLGFGGELSGGTFVVVDVGTAVVDVGIGDVVGTVGFGGLDCVGSLGAESLALPVLPPDAESSAMSGPHPTSEPTDHATTM